MAEEPNGGTNGGSRVSYTTKEILADINRKLTESALITTQLDRRMSAIEQRVSQHDAVLNSEIPKLTKFMQDFDVQRQVENALDSRKVRGVSTRDRVVVGGISACIMLVTLVDLLPKAFGG